jgi:hypothetical membrane protein
MQCRQQEKRCQFFNRCVIGCCGSAMYCSLSGYLTLSLEFFIGAEIIKTVVTRTYEEFSLLILVIISRGLFSLILYLERRWHGTAETE